MAEESKNKKSLKEQETADTIKTLESMLADELKESVDSEVTQETEISEDEIKQEDETKQDDGTEEKTIEKDQTAEKPDQRDQQIADLTDRLKRNMAEFENFRKRTEKEKAGMFDMGAKNVIEKMLPVVDNFERGLASIPEDAKGSAFAEGMEKIYKQLMKTLEDMGVTPIEAVGCQFDPNFHNAVMHIEDESLGENVIAQELQKGYMYRDVVVRHSMVQVAN